MAKVEASKQATVLKEAKMKAKIRPPTHNYSSQPTLVTEITEKLSKQRQCWKADRNETTVHATLRNTGSTDSSKPCKNSKV